MVKALDASDVSEDSAADYVPLSKAAVAQVQDSTIGRLAQLVEDAFDEFPSRIESLLTSGESAELTEDELVILRELNEKAAAVVGPLVDLLQAWDRMDGVEPDADEKAAVEALLKRAETIQLKKQYSGELKV